MQRSDLLFIVGTTLFVCGILAWLSLSQRPTGSREPQNRTSSVPIESPSDGEQAAPLPPQKPWPMPVAEVPDDDRPLEDGQLAISFDAVDAHGNPLKAGCTVERFESNHWGNIEYAWSIRGPGHHVIGLWPSELPLRISFWARETTTTWCVLDRLSEAQDFGKVVLAPSIRADFSGVGTQWLGDTVLYRQVPPPVWGGRLSDATVFAGRLARLGQSLWTVTDVENGLDCGQVFVTADDSSARPAVVPWANIDFRLLNAAGDRFPADYRCEWRNEAGAWLPARSSRRSGAMVPEGAQIRVRAQAQRISDAPEAVVEAVATEGLLVDVTVTQAADYVIHVRRGGEPVTGTYVWVCTRSDLDSMYRFGGAPDGYFFRTDKFGDVAIPLADLEPALAMEWGGSDPSRDGRGYGRRYSGVPNGMLRIGEFKDGVNEGVLDLAAQTGVLKGPARVVGRPEDDESYTTMRAYLWHEGIWGMDALELGEVGSELPDKRLPAGSYDLIAYSDRYWRVRFAASRIDIVDGAEIAMPELKLWPIELNTPKLFDGSESLLRAVLTKGEYNVCSIWQRSQLLYLGEGDYRLYSDDREVCLPLRVGADGGLRFGEIEAADWPETVEVQPTVQTGRKFASTPVRVRVEQEWPRYENVLINLGGRETWLPTDAPYADLGFSPAALWCLLWPRLS